MALNIYGSTLTGDGDSIVLKLDEDETKSSDAVAFSIGGTWSGVTATLHLCVDTNASPLVFEPVPNAAYTSDTADTWTMPEGALWKIVISGSGSPLPSLTYNCSGYIDRA